MFKFTIAKSTPRTSADIVCKLKGGKKAVLNKLNKFLTANEPKTVEWLVSFWNAQGNAITYKELREAYLSGGISEKQIIQWQKQYSNLVNNALAPQWYAAIKDAGDLVKAQYPYFLYEPFVGEMQNYIKQHGAELVTNLVTEQRNALNSMIAHAANYTGMTPDEFSRIIRPVIGLTTPQAVANFNYYKKFKESLLKIPKMTATKADKKALEAAAKYAARQHRYRAMNIARTELTAAYNQGHYGATKDAQAQGYIGACIKRWLTADDERVCPICGVIDGETKDMDSTFSVGTLLPPAHPSCRCAVAYEEITPPLTSPPNNGIINTGGKPVKAPSKQSLRNAALAKPKGQRTEADWRAIWDTDTKNWDTLSDKERSDILDKFQKDWIAKLTTDEKMAVRQYSGSAYTAINNYARTGKVSGGYDKSELIRLNDLLKSAFDKSDLGLDVRLSRGVRGSYADQIRNYKPGYIDVQNAVTSTSYTRNAAFRGLTMDISIPAGAGRGSLITDLSIFGDGEKEFLLAPGAKLRFIEYDPVKDRAYFELEP